MLTAKKKITVREAVPNSSVFDQWLSFQDFLRDNMKLLLGIVVAIVAAVVLWLVLSAQNEAAEVEASRMLRKAQELYQAQQYKLAISGDKQTGTPGLQEIVDAHGGTPSGALAALYLGNSYLYTNEFDKAIAAYEQASPSGDLLQSAVLSGKAAALEGKKQYAEAAALYEKAAAMYENDFLRATRYFNAARLFAIAGDKERAKDMIALVEAAETPRYDRDVERLKAQYGIE